MWRPSARMLAALLASMSKYRVTAGWLGSAIVRTAGADWSSAITTVAAPPATQAAAMAATRVRRGSRGVRTVGLWSGTVVFLAGGWSGRFAPSPVAVAPLLRGAHTWCERA